MKKTTSFFSVLALVALTTLMSAPTQAQVQAGPFTAFPSEEENDGRFLAAVAGLSGLSDEETTVGLSVPASKITVDGQFIFRIFDGDSGEPCSFGPTCLVESKGNWDDIKGGEPIPLRVRMYYDKFRSGDPDGLPLLGQWKSNTDYTGAQESSDIVNGKPLWRMLQPRMPNNGWWELTVQVTDDAVAPGGTGFYLVVIDLDAGGLAKPGDTVSNYKVSADVPLSVFSANFGFEAGDGGGYNDLLILYPTLISHPKMVEAFDLGGNTDTAFEALFGSDPFDFQMAPTTYDGTYEFFLDVDEEIETLTIWDGDFDHGIDPAIPPNGVPSGLPLVQCSDTDDPNTEGKPNFASESAYDEGAQDRLVGTPPIANTSNPADDTHLDWTRRSPCVRYTVSDPLGNTYLNDNPSGNQEWERFVISTDPNANADVEVTDKDILPAGLWRIAVQGLDISNSNFWRFEQTACGLAGGEPLCPEEPVTIGNRVWYDFNGDGVQDAGEPGITGVKVNRVGSSDVAATAVDPPPGEDGVYYFDVPAGSDESPFEYTVEIASENLESVTSGAVGDRVWLDVNGDQTETDDFGDPEPGLGDVSVRLLECAGGVPASSLAITKTDASGYYWFSGLAPGLYCTQVDEATLPSGLVQTNGVGGVSPLAEITSDENIYTLDFGYDLAGSTAALGDRLWADLDADGAQDEGEPGLIGVTVELYLCGEDPAVDPATAIVLTDAGGIYAFSDLAPGCYQVVVTAATLPAGVLSTFDYDDGTTPPGGADGVAQYTIGAGDAFFGLDFGYVGPDADGNGAVDYCLADRVWYDADANGLFDGDDAPLAGVGIDIRSGGGEVTATLFSGVDGRFAVCGLESSLYVVEIRDQLGVLAGLTGTTQGAIEGAADAIIADQDAFAESFGYIEQGWLANCRWTTNPPQNQNSDPDDDVLAFTPTSITDDIPFVDDGTGTLVPENNFLFDMGCEPQGSIGDFVWLDTNGDGVEDANEPGIAGVTVELRACGATGLPLDTIVTSNGSQDVDGDLITDPAGYYRFTGLLPDCYEVSVDAATLPADVEQTYDLDGVLDDEAEASIGLNEDRDDVDFGYVPLGSIGDRVWQDDNGDGVQDAGEPGIGGVTVELYDCTGQLVDSMVTSDGTQDVDNDGVTDAEGYYRFTDLAPRCYRAVVVPTTLPDGVEQTFDRDGTLDDQTEITLAGGEDVIDADFGYVPLGSIGDRVWLDTNGDGIQDAGEIGIAGVRVELRDCSGQLIDSQLTSDGTQDVDGDGTDDPLGYYTFTELTADCYRVTVDPTTLPADVEQTFDVDGALDNATEFDLGSAEEREDVDFGYVPLGSIGDRVWLDGNGNGIQDSSEIGIGGVRVVLQDCSGQALGSMLTSDGNQDVDNDGVIDPLGYYRFIDLTPGCYQVVIDATTLPGDVAQTFDRDGTLDNATEVQLGGGDVVVDADFGYVPLGSIGDRIWQDTDGDGIQDGGEPGIGGVRVVLQDCSGQVLGSMLTSNGSQDVDGDGIDDPLGYYRFVGLMPGCYTVVVDPTTLPDDVQQTFDRDGSLDNRTPVVIAGGEDIDDADFGYVPLGSIGDRVWLDGNGDGVQDVGEPGIGGVRMELRDCSGQLIESVFTSDGTVDPLGFYQFVGLTQGCYEVAVDAATLPAGVVQTYDLDGGLDNKAQLALAAGQDRTDADFGYFVPCGLTVEKTCQVLPPPTTDFVCSDAKPLDVVTMIWNGTENVDIKAWYGSVGSTLLETVVDVKPGDEVSISGYAGSPNDVFWEVFATGTTFKLGESKFHLSCSDDSMDGAEDCGLAQGDGKSDDSGFLNLWLLDGLAGNGEVLDCSPTLPDPASSCDVVLGAAPSCDTVDNPDFLTWQFTGGGCAAMDNSQEPGKVECTESFPGIDPNAPVFVTAGNDSFTVEPGGEFTISRGDSDEISLTQPGRFEDLRIHTSCSQPLIAGEVFGSLTLAALDGQRAGVQIQYNYTVSNKGPALSGVTVVDDKVDLGIAPFALGANSSESFSFITELMETTENRVDVMGTGAFGAVCSDFDTALVTVSPPPEPCDECDGGVTELTFTYIGDQSQVFVTVYDDKDDKAEEILFEDWVEPGDPIFVEARPGKDKLDSNISIWLGNWSQSFHTLVHTSCSDPIGVGFQFGDFEIVTGRSKNGGLFCDADCEPSQIHFKVEDDQVKFKVENLGLTPLQIQKVTATWPMEKGSLEKIEFDGTIWEGLDAAPSAEITEFTGDFDKRALDPGDNHELKLSFTKKYESGDHSVRIDFNNGCFIEASSSSPVNATFDCSKPIDELTMIWDGGGTVQVTAWKGSVGSSNLGTKTVSQGGEISFWGLAGSPNDVYWEIYDGTTKLGESKFHLSCSDSEMNGAEDCGKREGDGKGTNSSLINDWIFEGMVDNNETLDCTP